MLPITQAQELCEVLENCFVRRLPGGHFLHWEQPNALARELLEYLTGPAAA